MRGLSHAGGIVFRWVNSIPHYLVISAKQNPQHWVFPKGHMKQGESPEDTARREVREEAGVVAEELELVGTLEFVFNKVKVKAGFFLMRYVQDLPEHEGREIRWCPLEEALTLLTFEDSRKLLQRAHQLVLTQQRTAHK